MFTLILLVSTKVLRLFASILEIPFECQVPRCHFSRPVMVSERWAVRHYNRSHDRSEIECVAKKIGVTRTSKTKLAKLVLIERIIQWGKNNGL